MKVNLELNEIEQYLKNISAKEISKGETNAFRYTDLGSQKAAQDILFLIKIFNENFIEYLQEIYDYYSKNINPTTNGDRCNSDTHLLFGYECVIKKFVNIKCKKIRKE